MVTLLATENKLEDEPDLSLSELGLEVTEPEKKIF